MATERQKRVAKMIVENQFLNKPLSKKEMLAKVSYSKGIQKQPSRIIESEGVQEEVKSIAEQIPDSLLIEKHLELVKASTLEHMTFPLGPKDEKEKEKFVLLEQEKASKKGEYYDKDVEYITDEDIKQMFLDLSCKVRRIVHRETARDVYFWSSDNNARSKALDLAYKLKGSYAPEKSIVGHVSLDEEKEHHTKEIIGEYLAGNSK